MKITKAIIPAAGLGTRVLPASKAVPKEMLNIVDKPAIQYLVEEAAKSGITDILIITNRGKGVIEDHFDHAYELEDQLSKKPEKKDLYDSVLECSQLCNTYFLRQKETKGLGHAVLCAKEFVNSLQPGDPEDVIVPCFGEDFGPIGEDIGTIYSQRKYIEDGVYKTYYRVYFCFCSFSYCCSCMPGVWSDDAYSFTFQGCP